MGALHKALVIDAKSLAENDYTVVSIFVNPLNLITLVIKIPKDIGSRYQQNIRLSSKILYVY
jgi:pantothenate synthetase